MDGLVSSVPSLVIMLAVFGVFVRYLKSRDELFKTMSDDCHRVQREGPRAIKDFTEGQAELLTFLKHANGKS